MKTPCLRRRVNIAAGIMLLISANLHAATQFAAPADLPNSTAVEAALDAYPAVLAAQSRLAAARAESRRLNAGDYEYQARAGYTRRRESGNSGGALASGDWEMAIERSLRLPGKAKLDAEVGATLGDLAAARVGDARHEAARDLIATWYAVLRTQSDAQAWREQAGLSRQQREVVEKRIKAGDAAQMERTQAMAVLNQAQAETRRAEASAAEAAARLAARFPSLPLPTLQSVTLPVLSGNVGEWVDAALDHNHELAILQKEAERMRILARRQRANLSPDPTLGMHYSRERDGLDTMLGVSIALPLPGESRRAQVDVLTEEARALAQEEAGAKARIEGEIRIAFTRLQGALSRLESQESMTQQLDGYAELAWRAYELGETALWEALNARKSARDARRETLLSRLDTHEAAARLLLDTHRLWPFERDHASGRLPR